MENTNWDGVSGGLVEPFSFSKKQHQLIAEESMKHILDERNLHKMLKHLEEVTEIYLHRKNEPVEADTRRVSITKIDNFISHLKKTIDAYHSLDGPSRDSFFFGMAAAYSAHGQNIRHNYSCKSPLAELSTILDVAKQQKERLKKSAYTRSNTPRFLITEALSCWFKYTDESTFTDDGRFAWRDYKYGKSNSAVSFWLIAKELLEACGIFLEDPTNYILEVSKQLKKNNI